MNKVVDERLVPDGEYIDALNLRLGSTEQSEIGSVELTKGNEQLTTVTYTNSVNTPLPSGARCIGVYEDSATNTIYWFIHCAPFIPPATPSIDYTLDMIVSYNVVSDVFLYHVVTVNSGGVGETALNFRSDHLITGVNLQYFPLDTMISGGLLYPEPPLLTTTSVIDPLLTTAVSCAPSPDFNVITGLLSKLIISDDPYPTPVEVMLAESISPLKMGCTAQVIS